MKTKFTHKLLVATFSLTTIASLAQPVLYETDVGVFNEQCENNCFKYVPGTKSATLYYASGDFLPGWIDADGAVKECSAHYPSGYLGGWAFNYNRPDRTHKSSCCMCLNHEGH